MTHAFLRLPGAMSAVAGKVLLVLMMCASAMFATAAHGAAPPIRAEVSTQAFYQWYLSELSGDRDPFSDHPQQYGAHVSQALVKEISTAMNSAEGLDADYFLQAQDYLDDWLGSINTSVISHHPNSALVLVTLGRDKETIRRLRITLIVENGAWKIRKVRLA